MCGCNENCCKGSLTEPESSETNSQTLQRFFVSSSLVSAFALILFVEQPSSRYAEAAGGGEEGGYCASSLAMEGDEFSGYAKKPDLTAADAAVEYLVKNTAQEAKDGESWNKMFEDIFLANSGGLFCCTN